ncbi:hypothetical protein F4778DRAFT_671513 [Xylariomycetidae sp. FL2044]|nr:hypothetical protein F4778DRAFT_671513 [Xylariomycetidae sp. FL2044]
MGLHFLFVNLAYSSSLPPISIVPSYLTSGLLASQVLLSRFSRALYLTIDSPLTNLHFTLLPTYASLTKPSYIIAGSHSGVKICYWTLSVLSGRGSCYKYSFYSIASHRCMETFLPAYRQ